MTNNIRMIKRAAHRTALPLALSLVVPLLGCRSAGATEPALVAGPPAPPAPTAHALTLNLAECLRLALERQPRLAAQRASLAAAEDGQRALDALRLPATLDPELPIRRKQAALGVAAAQAGVEQAEHDTAYAVTRTYFTVLFAREQERVARGVVERLTTTRDTARRALDAGVREVTAEDVERASVYLSLAQTKQTQAAQGVKRALTALREAIGLGPDESLDVPAGRLPEPAARPNRDEVLAAALARRGELIQAGLFARVACLEVEAQGTSIHQRMQTFAAGADIHARPVPPEVRGDQYRPGAVAPEMPTMLAGSRAERVKHAESLSARAEAVVATTRNLIALEAEDAFLRWEEASQEARQARDAADAGAKLADHLSKDLAAFQKVRVEDVTSAHVLAAQARSQYNEFLYRTILGLADLERVTAGGFSARLVEAAGTTVP